MNTELTYTKIMKYLGEIKGLVITYDEDQEIVRFTSKYSDCISDINDWLLDHFPHYLSNIQYNVNNRDGDQWLSLICIRREVV